MLLDLLDEARPSTCPPGIFLRASKRSSPGIFFLRRLVVHAGELSKMLMGFFRCDGGSPIEARLKRGSSTDLDCAPIPFFRIVSFIRHDRDRERDRPSGLDIACLPIRMLPLGSSGEPRRRIRPVIALGPLRSPPLSPRPLP